MYRPGVLIWSVHINCGGLTVDFRHSVLHVQEIYALENVVFTLQSMGCTNHIFPVYATRNVQTHLKSTMQSPKCDSIRIVCFLLLLCCNVFLPACVVHLQELFQSKILPKLEGELSIREGKKSGWKRHTFVLRASGLYYSKSGKSLASKDIIRVVEWKDVECYTGTQYKKFYRAPGNFGFSLVRNSDKSMFKIR